jgi:filamentous hemagglutinin family protein
VKVNRIYCRVNAATTVEVNFVIIKKGTILLLSILFSGSTFANPAGGVVSSGNAVITQTPGNTVIQQNSDKAIINWQSFNIGAGEKTHFQQPTGGIALNRINATQGPSQIYGQLTANGKIILVNQAGIFFGPGSYVNVGGIIATTSGISDQNFLAGKLIFDQPSPYNGSVINKGTIIAAKNGLVAMLGNNVTNDGMIQAQTGNVVLASGKKFTVDLYGDQLINFTVDEEITSSGADENDHAQKDAVKNSGTIIADGGKILMTAKAASGVIDNVINMSGVARARSVDQKNGVIILSSESPDPIIVSGLIDATGMAAAQVGGSVKVLGKKVGLLGEAKIDASGDQGGGEILIGGNYQGKGPEQNAKATVIMPNVNLIADAISQGNGGRVIVWADDLTKFYGHISAQGGALSGNGGFVETSGKNYLDANGGVVNLLAAKGTTGTWLLDPTTIYIALDQTNATAAGMTGSNTSANTGTGGNPDIFAASGAAADSLLTTGNLTTALASANVIVTTANTSGLGNGDIFIVDPINWNSSNSLTLTAFRNITGNANITNAGAGNISLIADNTGTGTGTVSFSGVNTVTTSGAVSIYYNPTTFGTQDSIYTGGTTPTRYMLINSLGAATDSSGTTNTRSLATLSNSSTYWSDNFALAKNIDASDTVNWNSGEGFRPIGNYTTTEFTGRIDGQHYAIDGLYMNVPNSYTGDVGFIGSMVGATIANIGLTNANITSAIQSPGNIHGNIGILAGYTVGGSVTNAFSSGSVATLNGKTRVGGLIGLTNATPISNVFSSANVSASASGSDWLDAGGTIGANLSLVSNASSAGTVSIALSSSTGDIHIGGFVGSNSDSSLGILNNSYSVSSVTVTGVGSGAYAGGFIGTMNSDITNAYSSGAVSAPGLPSSNVGAFAGGVFSGSNISNSFWDTVTSTLSTGVGTGSSSGLTGITTAQALAQSTYTGFTFGTTPNSANWFSIDGYTRPMLQMEYATNINTTHQLQLMAMDLSADYTLANNIDLSTTGNNAADVWGTNATNNGSGFVPIGNNATNFTGTFDGQNHTIDGMYIDMPQSYSLTGDSGIGLFGNTNGAIISNIGMTNADITSAVISDVTSGGSGILVGNLNGGSVSNAYTTGSIHQTVGSVHIGGLIGLAAGALDQVYSSANVTVDFNPSASANMGGLVGYLNAGSITNSFSSGRVNANLGASGNAVLGGLVGITTGATISDSYSTSAVILSGTNTSGVAAGFVGHNGYLSSSSITDSYSIGYVTPDFPGSRTLGGLTAINNGVTTTSYWNTETSGLATSASGTGLTTTQLQTTLPSGFSSSTWGILANSYAYLKSFYPSAPRVISGTYTSGTAGSTIQIAADGTNIAASGFTNPSVATTSLDANGAYYFLQGNNVINDGAVVLLYQTSNGLANAVTVAPSAGAAISNLNLIANSIVVGDSSTQSFSNSILAQAIGALNDTNILYSVSGSNLTLGNATNTTANLVTTATTAYDIDGNIGTVTSGTSALDFGGAVTIENGVSTISTTGTQAYRDTVNLIGAGTKTLSSTLSSIRFYDTVDGGALLAISAPTGGVRFDGAVGAGTALSALNILSTTETSLYGPSITTTGDQNYIGIQLGANVELTSTLGNINITQNIGGANHDLTLNVFDTSSTLAGDFSGGGNLIKLGNGNVILSGANSYTGTTHVNAGTLRIDSAGGLGNTSGIDIAAGAILNFNSVNSTNTANITVNNGGQLALTTATINNSVSLSGTGADGPLAVSPGGSSIINGVITLTGDTNINIANASITLNSMVGNNHNLNLSSTSGNNNFKFNGTASGFNSFAIQGGVSSTDTIDFSGLASARAMTLAATGINHGFSGTSNYNGMTFENIDAITGNASVNNSLTGLSGASNWLITGTNSGSYVQTNTLGFSNFQTLIGGGDVNTFNFASGARISGSINGGSNAVVNDMIFADSGVKLQLSSLTSGTVKNASDVNIVTFNRVQQATATGTTGQLTLPTGKSYPVTYYNAAKTNGEIGDPFYFFNFSITNEQPITPTTTTIPTNISNVIAGATPDSETFLGGSEVTIPTTNDPGLVELYDDIALVDLEIEQLQTFGCFSVQ